MGRNVWGVVACTHVHIYLMIVRATLQSYQHSRHATATDAAQGNCAALTTVRHPVACIVGYKGHVRASTLVTGSSGIRFQPAPSALVLSPISSGGLPHVGYTTTSTPAASMLCTSRCKANMYVSPILPCKVLRPSQGTFKSSQSRRPRNPCLIC